MIYYNIGIFYGRVNEISYEISYDKFLTGKGFFNLS